MASYPKRSVRPSGAEYMPKVSLAPITGQAEGSMHACLQDGRSAAFASETAAEHALHGDGRLIRRRSDDGDGLLSVLCVLSANAWLRRKSVRPGLQSGEITLAGTYVEDPAPRAGNIKLASRTFRTGQSAVLPHSVLSPRQADGALA